jgi:hypothetical protein
MLPVSINHRKRSTYGGVALQVFGRNMFIEAMSFRNVASLRGASKLALLRRPQARLRRGRGGWEDKRLHVRLRGCTRSHRTSNNRIRITTNTSATIRSPGTPTPYRQLTAVTGCPLAQAPGSYGPLMPPDWPSSWAAASDRYQGGETTNRRRDRLSPRR